MPTLLDGLNPQQQAAVTLTQQSALILAGAGSGKTRVLTTRIAWLLHMGHAYSNEILAVTFTNKAAKEMLTRLSTLLPITPRDIWIGTFHGLANRLLRTHHIEAGLPRLFQILDQADQLAAIKRLLKALQVDTDKFEPRKVQQFINQNKDQGLRADRVETYDPYNRRLAELYAAYDVQCTRESVVDFAELLLRSYELLAHHPHLSAHYQARFRHILIDEFQDTNRLQYRWLQQFAGRSSALMAVGDDDQSIYAFRGAHSGNMQDFQRDFAHDNIIRLEQNYRSQGNILDAANALINHNPGRLGKTLWTSAGQGEPVWVHAADNDQEEANFVSKQALKHQQQGGSLSDMAVLYRSNAQSRVLEHALFAAGLAYRVYGGLRFFERQEIKHALAYLRLLVNPDDDNAFLRVVNFPTRGIGVRSLAQLNDVAMSNQCSLWRACQPQGNASGRGLTHFVELINTLREQCNLLNLPESIEQVLQASGLMQHYQTEKDGQDRVDNLAELINAASAFIQDSDNITSNDGVMADFLALASLESGAHQANAQQDALQLMTVHAAKGLEFHTVFVTGLEEGLFPSEMSMSEQQGVEEERRLMYVAITRARHRLYLSHAQSRLLRGQVRYGIPSRFLNELPPALLQATHMQPRHTMRHAHTQPPTPQRAAINTSSPWRLGMAARHPKFGIGVITHIEGQGGDIRLHINFGGVHGAKWLALTYAKLEAVA